MKSEEPYFCGYEFSHSNSVYGHIWEYQEAKLFPPKNWKILIHDKNGKLVYYE